ncbi:MAG: RNA polymerase sigma factor [Candidatus Brocadiaceae bacterium]|jgi:RNA polymerase sigma-70 factor (ECF subfamily)
MQEPRLSRTDEELLAAARTGDEDAFHGLIERHAERLFRLAFRLVSNTSDAEDVVQETFVGAFEGMGAFEGRSTVRTWLIRILVRQAARCHRRRSRRKAVSLEDAGAAGGRELRDASRGDIAGEARRRMDVSEALRMLSPKHREVVVLREYEGMSYAEMAETLNVPQGTVESRLYRARQELKALLRDYLPPRADRGGD